MKDISVDRLTDEETIITQGATFQKFRVVNTLGEISTTIEGIGKLAQLVEKILLTDPGRDPFAPTIGAGILGLIGSTIPRDNRENIFPTIMRVVAKAEDQIKAIQQPPGVDSEQLSSLNLVNAEYVDDLGEVQITIEVQSVAGSTFALRIP